MKYSDSGIIVQILTEKFGKQSYLIFGSKSKNKGLKLNLFTPMMPVELQVYHKPNGTLQKVKEATADFPVNSITSSSTKSTILFFLAELISKVSKDNEPDCAIFNFIRNSVQILELTEENCANFHVLFVFQFCKFLGLHPENNFSPAHQIFNIEEGRFNIGVPQHSNYIDHELSKLFAELFNLQLSEPHKIRLTPYQRMRLLEQLLAYYNYHLEKPGVIKSLSVLKETFAT